MLEVAVLVCSTLASAAVLSFLFFRNLSSSPSSPRTKSVALVVLGDIGRSPRMLYHVQSFARHGYETSILAYRGASTSARRCILHAHLVLCRFGAA